MPVQKLDEAITSASLSVLKQDGGDVVLASEALIIKVRTAGGVIDRLRTRFGRGRLARQGAGARTLESLGVPTAQVIGHGTAQVGQRPCEVLVMHRIRGNSLLAMMRDPSTPITSEHAVADAIGLQLAKLVMAGWYNRDHKPSNLIVQMRGDGDSSVATIAIIDTVDILPIKPRHKFLAAAVRMLASLMLEPTGCGCPPRLALRRRVLLAMHRELWRIQGQSEGGGDEGGTAGDALDGDWESQSTRAVWKMTGERIAGHLKRHGTATPRITPS